MINFKEFTTTNGYKYCLANYLTYDQFMAMQELVTRDQIAGQDVQITGSKALAVNKLVLTFLLLSLKDSSDVEVVREADSLPIPAVDGADIMAEVSKITNEASEAFTKKKGI